MTGWTDQIREAILMVLEREGGVRITKLHTLILPHVLGPKPSLKDVKMVRDEFIFAKRIYQDGNGRLHLSHLRGPA
jgi:hypothetical protein